MIRECNDDLILPTSAFRALSPTQPPADVFEQITPKRKERSSQRGFKVCADNRRGSDAVDAKDECCMNSYHDCPSRLCALGTWWKNITPYWIAVIRKGYRAHVRERSKPRIAWGWYLRAYYGRDTSTVSVVSTSRKYLLLRWSAYYSSDAFGRIHRMCITSGIEHRKISVE